MALLLFMQRKFLRLDDITAKDTSPALYKLLTRHWGLSKPNLVISIAGGDIESLFRNSKLHSRFRDGLIKTAVNTSKITDIEFQNIFDINVTIIYGLKEPGL